MTLREPKNVLVLARLHYGREMKRESEVEISNIIILKGISLTLSETVSERLPELNRAANLSLIEQQEQQ